jgi:hypothetical protein
VFQPPRFVFPARIVVRPVNDAPVGVPFVFAVEFNRISRLQFRKSRSEIDIVRDEQRLFGAESKDEALMTSTDTVIG